MLLLVFASSIAIVEFEDIGGQGASIRSAGDALWWSLCTWSSAGAGNLYPQTAGGRVVGVVLMAAGVGIFATAAGLLAAWFVGTPAPPTDPEVAAIGVRLAALEAQNAELHKILAPRRPNRRR